MNIMILLIIPVFLILGVGGILLQIFLSRRENKWLGLILPCITCLVALFYVLMYLPTGHVVQDVIKSVVVFLLANIPTGILLAIYFACRSGMNKKQQIDKMKIHDLE